MEPRKGYEIGGLAGDTDAESAPPVAATETEKAYLAAFVDGEGHISIGQRRTPNGTPGHYLVLGITNTNIAGLKRLQQIWGGRLHHRKQRAENHTPAAQLIWTSYQAANILRAIQPYMLLKAEQCRLALEFQASMGTRWYYSSIGPDTWEGREAIRVAMANLNRGGKGKRQPNVYPEKPALTCQECGQEFQSYQHRRKYCSSECAMRFGRKAYLERHTTEKVCPDCGSTFTTMRPKQTYCSPQCGPHGWTAEQVRKQKAASSKRYEKACAQCGTQYVASDSRSMYCSRPCRSKASRANGYEPTLITKTCPDCGTVFSTKRKAQQYCSPKCGPHGQNSKKGLTPTGVKH